LRKFLFAIRKNKWLILISIRKLNKERSNTPYAEVKGLTELLLVDFVKEVKYEEE